MVGKHLEYANSVGFVLVELLRIKTRQIMSAPRSVVSRGIYTQRKKKDPWKRSESNDRRAVENHRTGLGDSFSSFKINSKDTDLLRINMRRPWAVNWFWCYHSTILNTTWYSVQYRLARSRNCRIYTEDHCSAVMWNQRSPGWSTSHFDQESFPLEGGHRLCVPGKYLCNS